MQEDLLIPAGQTQIITSDYSLIEWYGRKALRFTVALGVGDKDGDLYITQMGCLAWRNRFGEVEWSLPVYNNKGSRVRRYAGWVSPRLYVEVQRSLEQRFGHKLKWVKKPRKTREILNHEGQEIIPITPSGGPRSIGEGIREMEGGEEQGDSGDDSIAAITREWQGGD